MSAARLLGLVVASVALLGVREGVRGLRNATWTEGEAGSVLTEGAPGALAGGAAGGALAVEGAPPSDDVGSVERSLQAGSEGAGSSLRPLDPNVATAAELVALPGIGPSKAKAIVDDRAARGPFQRVEDLDRVKGIGPATVERLRPWIVVP